MKKTKILERSFDFSLMIIDLYKFLTLKKKEYIMSKQVLRSGTSIGANVTESQAAQSKKDFIFKMAIASKEARETHYWLRLLEASDYLVEYEKKDLLMLEICVIINIVTKIVKSSKKNLENNL